MSASGYSRQSAGLITSLATITASGLENEFSAIANAFGVTGHDHSGSSQGGPIALATSVSGTLPIANGGTAGTTASAARTALGLVPGTDIQTYDATIAGLAGLTITQSSLVYGTGTDAFAVLAKDTNATRYLANTGTSNAPAWAQVALATGVSGTLPAANGGTGATSYTNGQLLIGNTSGNTLTAATLTAPAAGISITNSTGSITFGLANDLSALEGLSSTGFAARTTTDTWAQRTITGTTNVITVTNGDGVSGNPTLTVGSLVVRTDTTATLAVGYATTPYNVGTVLSGTLTPSEANGCFQYATNGGAHTLAPPSNNTNIVLDYTNNGSAGTITTSGFTKVSGSFDTTNAHVFRCFISKNNGGSLLQIVAMQ